MWPASVCGQPAWLAPRPGHPGPGRPARPARREPGWVARPSVLPGAPSRVRPSRVARPGQYGRREPGWSGRPATLPGRPWSTAPSVSRPSCSSSSQTTRRGLPQRATRGLVGAVASSDEIFPAMSWPPSAAPKPALSWPTCCAAVPPAAGVHRGHPRGLDAVVRPDDAPAAAAAAGGARAAAVLRASPVATRVALARRVSRPRGEGAAAAVQLTSVESAPDEEGSAPGVRLDDVPAAG